MSSGEHNALFFSYPWLQKLWEEIRDIAVKLLISVQPLLAQTYWQSCGSRNDDGFSCFEVLGLDVLIDKTLAPWLIEVYT